MKKRLQALLANEINLYAYHLPLDAHAELGNNAQFGRRLGLVADARFGEQDLGFIGPAGAAATPLRWPPNWPRRSAANRCCCPATAGCCAAWPGAPVAPRVRSRLRWLLAPMPT